MLMKGKGRLARSSPIRKRFKARHNLNIDNKLNVDNKLDNYIKHNTCARLILRDNQAPSQASYGVAAPVLTLAMKW
jgi:hypothetical protein